MLWPLGGDRRNVGVNQFVCGTLILIKVGFFFVIFLQQKTNIMFSFKFGKTVKETKDAKNRLYK